MLRDLLLVLFQGLLSIYPLCYVDRTISAVNRYLLVRRELSYNIFTDTIHTVTAHLYVSL